MYAILDNQLIPFDCHDNQVWKNVLINYFNTDKISITDQELESIENMQFERSVEAFYMIPLLIFCLEKSIEILIS